MRGIYIILDRTHKVDCSVDKNYKLSKDNLDSIDVYDNVNDIFKAVVYVIKSDEVLYYYSENYRQESVLYYLQRLMLIYINNILGFTNT